MEYQPQDAELQRLKAQFRQYALNSVKQLLPDGIRHPWSDGHHHCNLWIKFSGCSNAANRMLQFNDASDLYMKSRKDLHSEHRRLIVLEGMEPHLVDLIGADLYIPPAFFVAHCDEWTDLSIVDHTRAKQSASRYWKVPIPQTRNLPKSFNGPSGNYVVEIGGDGGFNRSSIHVKKSDKSVTFRGYVSFWSQNYGEDSWTAVVLTDPPKTRIRHLETNKIYELEDFSPNRQVLSEVTVNPLNGNSRLSWETTTPVYNIPILEAIKGMFIKEESLSRGLSGAMNGGFASIKDPFSATIYIRHFVRTLWEEWVSRNLESIHQNELADLKQHRGPRAFDHSEGKSSKALEDYQQLVDLCHHIRLDKKAVRTISWAFRIEGSGNNPEADFGVDEDKRVWGLLEERLDLLETQLGEWMNMFAQRAAMQETLEANRQARSAGQLTKLATVAVPFSVVAAVFSMGGEFAAGERLFFLFWAITLPTTFVLLLWVLHGDIKEWWKRRQSKSKGRTVKRTWTLLGWKLSFNAAAQPDVEKGE